MRRIVHQTMNNLPLNFLQRFYIQLELVGAHICIERLQCLIVIKHLPLSIAYALFLGLQQAFYIGQW